MFETIGGIITVVFWLFAIVLFVGWIILCIGSFISGKGWDIFRGMLSAVLGIAAFAVSYRWFSSIPWSLLISGVVGCLLTVDSDGSSQKTTSQKQEKYGIGRAFLDAYVEEKVIEEAVTNAIRKSKE